MRQNYDGKRVYLLKENGSFATKADLLKFVKNNKQKVEKGTGFTRYLLLSQNPEKSDPIEYFYLEDPNIPENYFPINSFGIYDRITLEETKRSRLKEDIIKILSESKKFGVYQADRISESSTVSSNKQVEAGF